MKRRRAKAVRSKSRVNNNQKGLLEVLGVVGLMEVSGVSGLMGPLGCVGLEGQVGQKNRLRQKGRTNQTTQKVRLDTLLVEKNFAETKAKSQAMIMAGTVLVDGKKIEKAGTRISQDAEISLIKTPPPYVSRGGLKLEGALKAFSVNVKGLTALDVGASTGGFTDCLLKFGAGHVFALDVGYGQIDWGLRNDPRVTVFERINIRHVEKSDFTNFNINDKTDIADIAAIATIATIDIAVIDVSFISLKLVLPPVRDIITKNGRVIALIKPQFEVGKGEVGKGGVVRDEGKHLEVVEEIKDFAVKNGFVSLGTVPSQILGPKGNREFFIYLMADETFGKS